MDGRPYVIFLTAINNHSLIIVDAVLLQKNSDNTFCLTFVLHFFLCKSATQQLSFKWEECSQKDGKPYFIVLTAIDNHSLIIVEAVLLPNTSENSFLPFLIQQKHNFT